MPGQIAYLARHHTISHNVCHKAILLITRGGRDNRFLTDTDLASRDELHSTHFVGMARPAILARLRSHNVDHRPSQAINEKGSINDMTRNDRVSTIGGFPDDDVLLRAHHVRRPGGGCRSAARQNLIPARIHGAAGRTRELLPSAVGGGTVPALPCNLAERRRHIDVFGGWVGVVVCVLCVVLLGKKNTKTLTKKQPDMLSGYCLYLLNHRPSNGDPHMGGILFQIGRRT